MRTILTLVLVLTAAGCNANRPLTVKEVPAPAGERSGQPNLVAGADGKMYLSWLDTAGTRTLKFASKLPEGWSEPQQIVAGDDLLVNYADFPSLYVLPEGGMAAHWLSTVRGEQGYNVHIAMSSDAGRTWTAPVTPHGDGTPTEHGFVTMGPGAGGGVSVLWLDSRKLVDGDSDDVAMMATNIDRNGAAGPEVEIDGRVCECCQPASVAVPGGLLAVYRDRTEAEVRDITVIRSEGGRWLPPTTVFSDGWEINACPINGPAISAAGENVAVAWFTAANNIPKVQVALSLDGGKTFETPVHVDSGEPVGRVDVVSMDSGSAIVSWIEHSKDGGQVRAREISPGGRAGEPVVVGGTSIGSASGFPRIERLGDTVVFAWTDTNQHRIRTAVLE